MSVSRDRRVATALIVLCALAVLVNLDRFIAGPAAMLRAHDLADQTITGLASCGDFWRSGLASVWDPTQLRGWPRAGSPMHPQMVMCIVGGVVPVAYVGPIFHLLVLGVLAAGSFLFVRFFLGRTYEASIAGAALNVTMYFFFHEHPMIPSAILLPSLVGFLALPAKPVSARLLLFGGAGLVMGLSNPPATLIAMPAGHVLLVLAAGGPARRAHLLRCAAFWCIYGIYYGPMMVALLVELSNSSRSLYRPTVVVPSAFLDLFSERLVNPAVLSPAAVLVALVGRRTWRGTLLLVTAVLAWVGLSAANDLLLQHFGGRLPILVSLSSTYYRLYYLVPVGLLVWAAWLFDETLDASMKVRARQLLLAAAFCAAVAFGVAESPRVFLPYWKYAAVVAGAAVTIPWWTRRAWSVVLVTAAIFLFGRYQFTWIYEVPSQGNLFVEPPGLGQPPGGLRSVTVMRDCDAVDLFPAQARAAGVDTMDGISNNYSRGFVERWRYFVADNPATCTARYAGWSTRAEVTLADVKANPDRILAWMWINNVGYVRAPAPIDHPWLELVADESFTFDRTHQVRRLLYRVDSPVGQVFTLPTQVAARASGGDLGEEERALSQIQDGRQVQNVAVWRVNGSHLRFSGAFDGSRTVVANMNYHPGWTVRIDRGASETAALPGPFGLIKVPTVEGAHVYELTFRSPTTWMVPVFMVIALGLLWIVSGWDPGGRIALIDGPGPGPGARLAGRCP